MWALFSIQTLSMFKFISEMLPPSAIFPLRFLFLVFFFFSSFQHNIERVASFKIWQKNIIKICCYLCYSTINTLFCKSEKCEKSMKKTGKLIDQHIECWQCSWEERKEREGMGKERVFLSIVRTHPSVYYFIRLSAHTRTHTLIFCVSNSQGEWSK